MQNPQTASKPLEHWCRQLAEHPLHVLPVCAAALKRSTLRQDTVLQEIANIIAADPAMTLSLYRQFQRLAGQRAQKSGNSIIHCVNLLGLEQIQQLARTFTPLPAPLASHLPYLTAIGSALTGAEHARRWVAQRQPALANNAWLAGILLGMVDALLFRIAPKQMQALQLLIRKEAIPTSEADQAVLGCSRPQLAHALATQWRFAQPVRDLILPTALPDPIFILRHALRRQYNPGHPLPDFDPRGRPIRCAGFYVHLAHHLAEATSQGGYSLTQQRIHLILAACLFISAEDARRLTNETLLALSRQWPAAPATAPASSLLWPLAARPRRRIKPHQLPAAVARLLGAAQTQPAAAPVARTAEPISPPSPPIRRAPPQIGLPSNNLPADLDRASLLNAPHPVVTAPVARFVGFKSLEKKQGFEQFLQQLASRNAHNISTADLLRTAATQLHDSTHLVRVVMARHNPVLNQLEAWFALGCDPYPPLRQFRIKLQPANLFTHLLKQPASLWLSPDRPNKAAGLMPGEFKQASQTDACFISSIHGPQGPVALLYADRSVNDRIGLTEPEYTAFKAASTACSRYLMADTRPPAAKPPSQ